MAVMRIHKTKNFTVMSNHHFKEKGMTLKAKGLLSLMLSLPDEWNYSVMGLVTLSKDGKDSVMTALAELEKFGYLTRKQLINEKGQFAGIEYHIFEEPQAETPVSEKPNSEFKNTENQNAENPPQLNTNQLNNLLDKNINKSNTNQSINQLSAQEMYEVLVNIDDVEVAELYREYIEWRGTTDTPLTMRGLKMLIARCERLSNFDVSVQKAMVETALIQGWKNVFKPKDEELQGRNAYIDERKKFYLGE